LVFHQHVCEVIILIVVIVTVVVFVVDAISVVVVTVVVVIFVLIHSCGGDVIFLVATSIIVNIIVVMIRENYCIPFFSFAARDSTHLMTESGIGSSVNFFLVMFHPESSARSF
jgi:hypothetical protein